MLSIDNYLNLLFEMFALILKKWVYLQINQIKKNADYEDNG